MLNMIWSICFLDMVWSSDSEPTDGHKVRIICSNDPCQIVFMIWYIFIMVYWLEQGCWKHRIRIFFCYGNNETRWRKPWWKNWPDRHIHFAANFPTNCPKVRFSIILTYPDQGSVGREGAKKIWVAGYGWDEDRMAQTRASSNGGFTEPCLRLKLDEFFNKKLVINCILFTRL